MSLARGGARLHRRALRRPDAAPARQRVAQSAAPRSICSARCSCRSLCSAARAAVRLGAAGAGRDRATCAGRARGLLVSPPRAPLANLALAVGRGGRPGVAVRVLGAPARDAAAAALQMELPARSRGHRPGELPAALHARPALLPERALLALPPAAGAAARRRPDPARADAGGLGGELCRAAPLRVYDRDGARACSGC